MANMNSSTSNPLCRWWHPLPMMSIVGPILGFVIMKLTGMLGDWPWWLIVAVPLVMDIIINAAVLGIEAMSTWISDRRNSRR